MDKREYLRIVQVGTSVETLKALKAVTDYKLTWDKLDAKILARRATKPSNHVNQRPKFRFTPLFFTKLNLFPAVTIEVRESRSHIRKTCYGFRDKRTGERIYLRVDPGAITEFRDGTCGYLLGTKYLVPRLDNVYKAHRWDKVNRLMTRLLSRDSIIVTGAMVDKYRKSSKSRLKLAKRLLDLRSKYLPKRDVRRATTRAHKERLKREKAN